MSGFTYSHANQWEVFSFLQFFDDLFIADCCHHIIKIIIKTSLAVAVAVSVAVAVAVTGVIAAF